METTSKIQTQPEIKTALLASFQEVAQFLANISDENFYLKKDEKWSIGENLDHLILSTKPLASGLKQSKFVFRVFGTSKNGSITYDELVAKYLKALAENDLSNNPYVSKNIEATTKEQYLANWKMIGEKFQERLDLWTEQDLDKYRVKHPLIGKLTIREILFFTIYHNGHHLKTMKTLAE